MIKLNTIHYPIVQDINISKELSLNILNNNELYYEVEKIFLKKFSYSNLKTFSFNQDGFLSLLFELKTKGSIAISLGETNAVVEAGKLYESLGFEILWVELQKDGQVNVSEISKLDVDFLFLSSYVMDTFVKTNLEQVKKLSNAQLISNASAEFCTCSDIVYYDPYKLIGCNTSGVILHDNVFAEQSIGYIDTVAVYLMFNALNNQQFVTTMKKKFMESLLDRFKDDIYFFVDNNSTLDFTLHFALKDIKARELIRTLALDEILITNGEGCTLGLSQPSKIIQAMGYSEDISRNGISLSFSEEIDDSSIKKVTSLFYKKYRQIKVLT